MTQLPVGGSWGLPTGDCFAGSVDKCHQVRRYFTRYPAAEGMGGGCSGHAVESARPHRGYRRVQVWFFPPRGCLKEVIGKRAQERKIASLWSATCQPSGRLDCCTCRLRQRLLFRLENTCPCWGTGPTSMLKEGDYHGHLSCSRIWFEKPRRPARVGEAS
jgi:hypothetical protein